MGEVSLKSRHVAGVLLRAVQDVPARYSKLTSILGSNIQREMARLLLKTFAHKYKSPGKYGEYCLTARFFEELDTLRSPPSLHNLGKFSVFVIGITIPDTFKVCQGLSSVSKILAELESSTVKKFGFDSLEDLERFVVANAHLCDVLRAALDVAISNNAAPPSLAANRNIKMHPTNTCSSVHAILQYLQQPTVKKTTADLSVHIAARISMLALQPDNTLLSKAVCAVLLEHIEQNAPGILCPVARGFGKVAPLLAAWGQQYKRIIVKKTPPTAIYCRSVYDCAEGAEPPTYQYSRIDDFQQWYVEQARHGLGDIVKTTPEVRDGFSKPTEKKEGSLGSLNYNKLRNVASEVFTDTCETCDDYLRTFSNDPTEVCMCCYDTAKILAEATGTETPTWDEPLERMGTYAHQFMVWLWRVFDASDNSRQAFYLSGFGTDGKSVIAKVIARVLGPRVCGEWATDSKSDFIASSLVGKRLLIVPELKNSATFLESQLFHQVTGQDNVTYNIKNQPFGSGTFKGTKVLILTNKPLETGGQRSVETRILWAQILARTTVEEDFGFEDRLYAEFPNFLARCKAESEDPRYVDGSGMIRQDVKLTERCRSTTEVYANMFCDALIKTNEKVPATVLAGLIDAVIKNPTNSIVKDAILEERSGAYRGGIVPNMGAGITAHSLRTFVDMLITRDHGWTYNKGVLYPPCVGERDTTVTNTSAVTIATPTPMEEEIDLDKLVTGAMNQTEATEATELSLD